MPLVAIGDGVPANERCADLTSRVDLFDTLCDLAGIESPEMTSGISLFGPQKNDSVFSEHGIYKENRRNPPSHFERFSPEILQQHTAGRKIVRTKEYRFEMDSDGNQQLYDRPSNEEIEDESMAWHVRLRLRLIDTLGTDFGDRRAREDSFGEVAKSRLRELGYFE